jgi:hypothetical protein
MRRMRHALLAGMVLVAACARAPVRAPATASSPDAAPAPAASATELTAPQPRDAQSTDVDGETEDAPPCPDDMAFIPNDALDTGGYCVDKYEASLVEEVEGEEERAFPHYLPVDGHIVRAVSRPGVFPQGYISELQARDACAASGKRLCTHDEWRGACMGPAQSTFPYGDDRRPGVCNDTGKSAVIAVFGAKAVAASSVPPRRPAARTQGRQTTPAKGRVSRTPAPVKSVKKGAAPARPAPKRTAAPKKRPTAPRPAPRSVRPASVAPSVWTRLNDPLLGQVEGALARTGAHPECANAFGVFDLVGNLHEWVATDPSSPTGLFAGGYYLDTKINGDGCGYKTTAHGHDYHDYSTGFRCCDEARESERQDE